MKLGATWSWETWVASSLGLRRKYIHREESQTGTLGGLRTVLPRDSGWRERRVWVKSKQSSAVVGTYAS